MAVKYAIIGGEWSNPAIWNGGTVPQAGDDVFCNGYVVYIHQSITVSKISNGAYIPSGIIAGGFFNAGLGGDISLNTNIEGHSGYVLLCNSSTGIITINGNLNCFAGSLYALYINSSAYRVILNGNSDAGTGQYAIYCTSPGGFTINGDLIGGTILTNGFGMYVIYPSENVIINGNVYASLAAGVSVSSYNNTLVTVNGNIYASISNYGLIMTNTPCRAVVNGIIYGNYPYAGVYNQFQNNICVVKNVVSQSILNGSFFPVVGFFTFALTGSNITVFLEDGSAAVLTVGGEVSGQLPIEADVRAGVDFALGTKTGTCEVPPKEAVGFGVPVDDTEGEAVFSFADWLAALTASSNPIAVRLKNVATPESVAAIIETSING